MAIGRCKRSTASARSAPRCSSLRSVTSRGSRHPRTCVRGAGSRPAIASPISRRVRGRISKQGSRLIRATLIEGVSRYHGGTHLDRQYQKIAKRRGRNKARIALARKVLTLVYYGLRDGEIRCLAPIEETAA